MNFVESEDPEVWSAIAAEQVRQQEGLEMIASENFTSPAVMQAPVAAGLPQIDQRNWARLSWSSPHRSNPPRSPSTPRSSSMCP